VLPEQIIVGPWVYTVVTDREKLKKAHADLKCSEDESLLGYHDPKVLEIGLDISVPPSVQRSNLLHETLHAICEVTGWTGKADEETTVTRLSPMLMQVLAQNPGLVGFLTETG
jgi:hypothetical protein